MSEVPTGTTESENGADGDRPDIGFTLATATDEPEVPTEQRMAELADRIGRELGENAPGDWVEIEAVFALTVAAAANRVLCLRADGSSIQLELLPAVAARVSELRELSAELADGPWWRMVVRHRSGSAPSADYDYGEQPFPDEFLFPPEAYELDLEQFPRSRLPVWLAAYLRHGGRQLCPPGQSALRVAAAPAHRVDDQLLPPLPLLWARWSVLAAGFVAARSPRGPRVLPSMGVFEGAGRSGSTLYLLPGDRAVLSGGVWNDPILDAAYNEGAPLPDLLAGAPDWVADPVLNPRVAGGQLSFCFWWDGAAWAASEPPSASRFRPALPAVWDSDAVVGVLAAVAAQSGAGAPDADRTRRLADLVAAAETGITLPDTLGAAFGIAASAVGGAEPDLDSAWYQLSLAGCVAATSAPLPRDTALARVRAAVEGSGADTSRYPLDALVADRLGVGWMVYAPVAPGEILLGRAIFYIADDGVIERSSSSIPPTVYAVGFAERYRQRRAEES
ncbi:hypothetical protein BOX37_03960 [Nocardia mangyaensis]|uniref:Uncharacterized protein n=1 Tax=Nocardia mangyaensis TaxID=2213200 RepID=A0A1J0VMJ7_9NOCA|nr:hypothetical protein [Nocardia mangyaensis]APE33259.1 hypothetical protein BOX37_03960 [Nocardia mangyaensis]